MSSTALVAMQPNGAALAAPDLAERRRLLADLIMRNGSEAQVDLVMHLCSHYGLDPLLKHLVLINGSAYITRDGLLHIAHQSGQFDGIEVALERLEDGEWAATCTVWRRDTTRPFRYTVYQREHQQGGGGAWAKYPRAMLAKCFDEETEVLTTRGFERFGDVWGQVLQVTEHGLEPTEATPFVQAYSGPMVTLDSDDLNFRVTPNHDMVTTTGKVEAGEMFERSRSRSVYRIPRLVKGDSPDAPVSDQMIRLAAAYIADGHDTSANRFIIKVSRPRKIAELERIGGFHSRDTIAAAGQAARTATRTITSKADKEQFLYHRGLVSFLCGPNKTIRTESLLQLSGEQASLFVDSLLFHDGSTHAHSGARTFYTSRVDHAEAFELAAVMAGFCVGPRRQRTSDISSKPNYAIAISERDAIPVRRLGRAYLDKVGAETTKGLHLTENEGGRVWCVTVPSGVIVVRRRGFSMLCGNCAEVSALRRAFDVSLGAVEELGYDGQSPQSSLGQVVEVAEVEPAPEPPAPPARPGAPAGNPPGVPATAGPVSGRVEDYSDDALLTLLGERRPVAQVSRAVSVYLGRATDRDDLERRWRSAVRAGAPRAIADPASKAVAERLKEGEPGAYQRHARADGRPILGDTPEERLAMLGRIRAALDASGKTEREVNAYVGAVYNVASFEVLTADEAEDLIAVLEARGDEDEGEAQPAGDAGEGDGDDVPF